MNPTTEKNRLRRLALAKITVLALSALLVAALGVSVANDLYAFVKPEREVILSLDEPIPLKELAERLAEEGVITNPTVFRYYAKHQGKTELLENFCGTVTLNAKMSYRQILLCFSQ